MVERAKEFMRKEFKDSDRDWFYTRLGLLVDYIDHITSSHCALPDEKD
jgi:hypothetical protein